MTLSTNRSNFFQLGGSLCFKHPSYVHRKADDELYNNLMNGYFCYVLNSRQTGKSSLRVQTMHKLGEKGVVCGEIDLTGTVTVGQSTTEIQFYRDIIEALVDSFNLDIDVNDWFNKHHGISPKHRFSKFIEKILLTHTSNNIVIFIDEIDGVLNYKFKDDFFAAIRYCYNKRADNPEYNRLTYALFGVATPSDLIANKDLTPFNIGTAIELRGFQLNDIEPLVKGLTGKVNAPKMVVEEIFNWTNGQPLLTQKLCEYICQQVDNVEIKDISAFVENIVKTKLIDKWEFQDDLSHFKTIRDRILAKGNHSVKLLGIYQKILQGKFVAAKDSYEQILLKLSGLVIQINGHIEVYNPIYKIIFNNEWVEKELSKLRPYSEAITAWINSGCQDESCLLQGKALEEALAWSNSKSLSDEDHKFLNASRDFDIRELKEEVKEAMKTKKQANSIILLAGLILIKAKKQANRLYIKSSSLAVFASVAAIVAITWGGKAFLELQEAKKSSEIELSSLAYLQQFDSSNEKANVFINTMKVGQDLQELVKDGRPLQKYPTVSPLLALQTFLYKINDQKQFYSINYIDFSPDGQKLASAGQDGFVRIWTSSGKLLKSIKVDDYGVKKVMFSSDSQRLVTLGENNNVEVWHISGKQLFEVKDIRSSVKDLGVGPTRNFFTVEEYDNTFTTWDFTNKNINRIIYANYVYNNRYESIFYNPDVQIVLTLTSDGREIHAWDIKNKQKRLLNKFILKHDNISKITTNASGDKIFASGFRGKSVSIIEIWSIKGKYIASIKPSKNKFLNIYYHDDYIVTLEEKDEKYHLARIWNLSGKQLNKWQVDKSYINQLFYSKKDKYFAMLGTDNNIRIRNFLNKQTAEIKLISEVINYIAFSPNGKLIATGENNGAIKLWNSSGKLINEIAKGQKTTVDTEWLKLDNEFIEVMGFSYDWNYILTKNNKNIMKVWNRSGKLLSQINFSESTLRYVRFSVNNKYITTVKNLKKINSFTVTKTNTELDKDEKIESIVQVWNLSGKKVLEIKNFRSNVRFSWLSPDEKFLITVEENGTAKLWDITGKQLAEFKGHSKVKDVAFSSTAYARIATVDEEGKIQLWDLSGKKLKEWKASNNKLNYVYFDGKQIITAGQDDKVRIWDFSGSQLKEIKIPGGNIYFANLSPDKNKILTTQWNSNAYTRSIWDLSGRKIAEYSNLEASQLKSDWQYIATLNKLGRIYIHRVKGLDELLTDGCRWLKGYFDSHPDELKELKVCQNKVKPK